MSESRYERALIAGFENPVHSHFLSVLASNPNLKIYPAPSIRIAAAHIRSSTFELFLIDHQLENGEGILLGPLIRRYHPDSRAFLLIENPRWLAMEAATKNGYDGAINSSLNPHEIISAINGWKLRGENAVSQKLSGREIEIMRDLTLGSTTYEISMKRHITEATVKSHLTSIYRKLEVRNRVEAVTAFQRAD